VLHAAQTLKRALFETHRRH